MTEKDYSDKEINEFLNYLVDKKWAIITNVDVTLETQIDPSLCGGIFLSSNVIDTRNIGHFLKE